MDICNVFFVHPYPRVIIYLWCFIVFSFEVVNDRVCVSIYHETNSAVNISESGDFVVFFGYFYFAVHADVDIVGFFIHSSVQNCGLTCIPTILYTTMKIVRSIMPSGTSPDPVNVQLIKETKYCGTKI